MKDRIEQIIEYYGMTPSQFADTIGVQRPTLHHILSGRNNASLDIVSKIRSAFPEVSIDWIISGDGQMLRSATSVLSDEFSENNPEGSPLFPDLFQNAENLKNPATSRRGRKKLNSQTSEQNDANPAVSTPAGAGVPASVEPKEIAEVIVFYTDGSFSKISR